MESKSKPKRAIEFDESVVYGRPMRAPILGKHFKLPGKLAVVQPPVLDTSLSYIPVYSHLKLHDIVPIERPPTPEILRRTKELEFMEFFEAGKK